MYNFSNVLPNQMVALLRSDFSIPEKFNEVKVNLWDENAKCVEFKSDDGMVKVYPWSNVAYLYVEGNPVKVWSAGEKW